MDKYDLQGEIENIIWCGFKESPADFDDMDLGETMGFYGCSDEEFTEIINEIGALLKTKLKVAHNLSSNQYQESIDNITEWDTMCQVVDKSLQQAGIIPVDSSMYE